MTLIRTGHQAAVASSHPASADPPVAITEHDAPPALMKAPDLEQAVRAWHHAGHSQRAISRELNIDRRKVKTIIDRVA
jgi:DNA-binding NarL/FixJ family response regulator